MQNRVTQLEVLNLKPSVAPRFIHMCYNYGNLSHRRPRRRKLFVRNNKKNITNQASF